MPLSVIMNDLNNEINNEGVSPPLERPESKSREVVNNVELSPSGSEKSFASIRKKNLNAKSEKQTKTQQPPNANTIVEEALLEDLCEEASLELEVTKNGPMSNEQKKKLLTRLSTNDRTKHHFQNPNKFESYVKQRIEGDDQIANILNVDQSKMIKMTSSNCSNRSRISMRTSHRSMKRQSSLMSFNEQIENKTLENRPSHKDLTTQLRSEARISRSSRTSRMSGRTPIAPGPIMEALPEEYTEGSTRYSKMTTYSLPNDFVTNDNLPMNEVNRRKTNIVCKTNEETIKMANRLVENGALTMTVDYDSDDESTRCLCCYCSKA